MKYRIKSLYDNNMSTRTAEDFFKFLGQKPERLGIISSLYDQYTATYLTEALMNSFAGSNKPAGFTSIPSFVVEWSIKVSKIKRLRMLSAPEGDGACAGDVKFYFDENYYQKYDTFIIERTRQQFIVLNRPQRLRDKCWLVIAKILDDDYDSVVLGGAAGDTTRWISNNHPELHSEGYTKYTSNTENFRTYIATHRNDVDMSAMYKPLEEVFISIGKGSNANGMDPVYKMNTAEKDCFDNFMEARANASL